MVNQPTENLASFTRDFLVLFLVNRPVSRVVVIAFYANFNLNLVFPRILHSRALRFSLTPVCPPSRFNGQLGRTSIARTVADAHWHNDRLL